MSDHVMPLLTGQPPALYVFAASGDGFASPLFDALRAMMAGQSPQGGQPPQAVPPASGAQGGAGAAQGVPEEEQGRRQPLPRGEAERRVLMLLAENPKADYTPGQIAREIDARGCRDLMARLHARGIVEIVNEHPLTYRAAPRRRRRGGMDAEVAQAMKGNEEARRGGKKQ